MSTTSTTIRVPTDLRDRLVALASQGGVSVAEVVEQAVAAQEREAFWDRVRTDALAGRFTVVTGALPDPRDGLDPQDTWEDILTGGAST